MKEEAPLAVAAIALQLLLLGELALGIAVALPLARPALVGGVSLPLRLRRDEETT